MTMPSSDFRSSNCPCKKVAWSLSSFTAAEYGDANALARALEKIAKNGTKPKSNETWREQWQPTVSDLNTGGITPLHLAAQHGRVSATWLLLEQGHPVDGLTRSNATTTLLPAQVAADDNNEISPPEACTPLHRASFSGAVATMRLLLEKQADLLARDKSFGDMRTPLHKAAAGGRYLAVSLLVDALREQNLLAEGLAALDKNQQTPLQVARSFQQIQDDERASVARWDHLAGGPADWDKCVAFLEAEMKKNVPKNDVTTQKSSPIMQGRDLPSHDFSTFDCLTCGEDGECITASWTNAFTQALQQNFKLQESKQLLDSDLLDIMQHDAMEMTHSVRYSDNNRVEQKNGQSYVSESGSPHPAGVSPTPSQELSLGRSCMACGKNALALFPADDKKLVCKKCRPRRKKNSCKLVTK